MADFYLIIGQMVSSGSSGGEGSHDRPSACWNYLGKNSLSFILLPHTVVLDPPQVKYTMADPGFLRHGTILFFWTIVPPKLHKMKKMAQRVGCVPYTT